MDRLLERANPKERANVYADLGVTLTYRPTETSSRCRPYRRWTARLQKVVSQGDYPHTHTRTPGCDRPSSGLVEFELAPYPASFPGPLARHGAAVERAVGLQGQVEKRRRLHAHGSYGV
jgi:hypothetical protein